MTMFWKYSSKDKMKFIIAKLVIIISLVLMGLLAAHLTKLELPTLEDKMSWGIGWGIVALVVAMAIFNRLKILFKIKSLGFIVVFIILSLLKVGIDALIITIGLVTIPLLIDDIIISNYFKYLDYKVYGRTI